MCIRDRINIANINTAVNGSSIMKPIKTGGIVAKSAPSTGMNSSKKHRIPNRNQPGKSKPIGEIIIVITNACPALQVTFDTT